MARKDEGWNSVVEVESQPMTIANLIDKVMIDDGKEEIWRDVMMRHVYNSSSKRYR